MRVLLNLGGDVLNFLFGSARGAELQTLHQVDDRINYKATKHHDTLNRE
jgi:hypothetical protein